MKLQRLWRSSRGREPGARSRRGGRANPAAQVGDFIAEPLPPMDFGRIAAQSAKQVIVQKVREAERDRQYDEYKDRIGEIVNGTVKRVEYGNVIVDLGRGEAIIRRDEMIPRETFRTATASAPMSTTCAASSAARRSSCRAPIRSSWPSCSPGSAGDL
jgi:N utilization substance protein A